MPTSPARPRAAVAGGVALRPHAKTHKSADIARLQLEAGAVGLTVATVGEAEAFAAEGVADLFVAYPLWLTAELAGRLRSHRVVRRTARDRRRLRRRCPHRRRPPGRLGGGGAGRGRLRPPPQRRRARPRPGRSRSPPTTSPCAASTPSPDTPTPPTPGPSRPATKASPSPAARASVTAAGLEIEVVSGGSTPSLEHADTSVLTEVRPGVYVFGDAQQWELGSATPDQVALTAVATVVSHAGGRAVLDAGSKVLGADRASYASGSGRLLEHPEARIVQLSEHHAVVELPGRLPRLGSRVLVVPNHCCSAVNLADELWPTTGSAPWPVTARGRNG